MYSNVYYVYVCLTRVLVCVYCMDFVYVIVKQERSRVLVGRNTEDPGDAMVL